jgi:hypothetical protein
MAESAGSRARDEQTDARRLSRPVSMNDLSSVDARLTPIIPPPPQPNAPIQIQIPNTSPAAKSSLHRRNRAGSAVDKKSLPYPQTHPPQPFTSPLLLFPLGPAAFLRTQDHCTRTSRCANDLLHPCVRTNVSDDADRVLASGKPDGTRRPRTGRACLGSPRRGRR